jgi:hypothetical protein
MLGAGLVVALAPGAAWGQGKPTPVATANVPGIVRAPTNGTVAGGMGGTAARVEVGGKADATGTMKDPTAGTAFDDTTMPGLSQQLTIKVGTAYKKPYNQVKGLPIEVAEGLRYNVQTKAAKANGDRLFSSAGALQSAGTVVLSNALQTVAKNVVTGEAQAQVAGKTALAFAAGLNNDPTFFTKDNPAQPLSIQFVIGAGFSLTAEDPDQTAEALFQLATDRPGEGAILQLDIHIDGSTQSLGLGNIDVLQFNPALFASEQAIQMDLLSQLSFDATTHTLAPLSGEILLYQSDLSPSESSVTATFNYGGIVTAVPEPAALALLGLGGGLLLAALRVGRPRSGRRDAGTRLMATGASREARISAC